MATTAPTDLSVITFNVHHGAGTDEKLSLRRIADVITATDADLVGLQEVDRHYGDRSNWGDQPAELAALTDMEMIFGANLDEEPPAGRTDRRQYGTAILSRHPITSWDNATLYRSGDGEQRGLLRATVDVEGRAVSFCCTHLAVESADVRRRQVIEILELVDGGGHTVLVGDLNALPDTREIRTLSESLADTWAVAGDGDGATFPSDHPRDRIDYILAGGRIQALSAEVFAEQPEASDHRAVLSRIRLL